jgi:hypothetical protein
MSLEPSELLQRWRLLRLPFTRTSPTERTHSAGYYVPSLISLFLSSDTTKSDMTGRTVDWLSVARCGAMMPTGVRRARWDLPLADSSINNSAGEFVSIFRKYLDRALACSIASCVIELSKKGRIVATQAHQTLLAGPRREQHGYDGSGSRAVNLVRQGCVDCANGVNPARLSTPV